MGEVRQDSVSSAYGATPIEWMVIIRCGRIGTRRKCAALIFASYAEVSERNGYKPGEGIHCGVARLATDAEIGYSTAQRYLAWMREVGIIELTKPGNARKRRADEYRLIMSVDAMAAIGASDPTAYKELVGAAVRANAAKRDRVRSDLTKDEVQSHDRTSNGARSDLTKDEVPPSPCTDPTSLTNPETDHVRTGPEVARARTVIDMFEYANIDDRDKSAPRDDVVTAA